METRIDEIAAGIYRLSTYMPDIAPPAGFTFNQFLVTGDESLLFHCGMRGLFPLISGAVTKIMPIENLRWISFGHVEADECGSMNAWLAAAPRAQVAHGRTACMVSLNDLADRAPRMLNDGEVIDIGGKRISYIDTPHVPHGWEAGVIYEETTGTLLCGDLFTHLGNGAALTRSGILEPAVAAEEIFRATSLGAHTAPTLLRLADLTPTRLALMHGSSYEGDAAGQLRGLADYYAGSLMKAAA